MRWASLHRTRHVSIQQALLVVSGPSASQRVRSNAGIRCPHQKSLLEDKEAPHVGNQCLRLATRGQLGAKQSSRKVRAEESKLVVKRSSRRWGGSDLYSGHCTKLPHLIGHLRCLREELASSTGMEGVGERIGGKVIVGKAPHTTHSHVHTRTHRHTLEVNLFGSPFSLASSIQSRLPHF